MNKRLLARIGRTVGVPDLVGILSELSASDLQSLLLAVHDRRARAATRFGMCTAGRDAGSFRFELQALLEHVDYYLRLVAALRTEGRAIGRVRVPVTGLENGPPAETIEREVLAVLAERHPDVEVHAEPGRVEGRGYYVGVCFHVYAEEGSGTSHQLADGGLTTWTQQLASDRKERLLISGFGSERVLGFA